MIYSRIIKHNSMTIIPWSPWAADFTAEGRWCRSASPKRARHRELHGAPGPLRSLGASVAACCHPVISFDFGTQTKLDLSPIYIYIYICDVYISMVYIY